uniref:Uncharacterized protein n=1 Tax=Rhizophora mucronata TaxID=61149 RepID=A0A2P2N6Z8_RHIMU
MILSNNKCWIFYEPFHFCHDTKSPFQTFYICHLLPESICILSFDKKLKNMIKNPPTPKLLIKKRLTGLCWDHSIH